MDIDLKIDDDDSDRKSNAEDAVDMPSPGSPILPDVKPGSVRHSRGIEQLGEHINYCTCWYLRLRNIVAICGVHCLADGQMKVIFSSSYYIYVADSPYAKYEVEVCRPT
jgi:hypothetical protein